MQATTSGSGNGSGNSSSNAASAGGAAGAGSPASASLGGPSPPQFQTHFYGPAGATSHHHPAGAMASNPHAPPPPPSLIEHLYYSYPPPPHAQPPPHHAGPLTLSADQQLLIYSTDLTGQSVANDSQISQQEVRYVMDHCIGRFHSKIYHFFIMILKFFILIILRKSNFYLHLRFNNFSYSSYSSH